jgi:hypothetical protein
MSDSLRQAAQQALLALKWSTEYRTGCATHVDAYEDLRAALAEEPLQRLTDVHQEIEATERQVEILTDALHESRKADKAVLRQALEALVHARVRPAHKQDPSKYEAAIAAIKERLQ